MSKALTLVGGEETTETARFVGVMDKFFDALNVSNFSNGKKNRKPFQDPYRSEKDIRLSVSYTVYSNNIVVTVTSFTLILVAER